MSKTLFEQSVRTAGATDSVGCLGAGALIACVVAGINAVLLSTGASMTPSLAVAVTYSTPLAVLAALGLGAGTWLHARQTARRLTLAVSPDFELEGPFAVRYGWFPTPGGRGIKTVWCDVHREGEFVVRFSQSLRRAPAGWPQALSPQDGASRYGGFIVPQLEKLAAVLGS